MPTQAPQSSDDELNRTREAFREFMSVAVHDLREPLRGIGINTDLLVAICGNTLDERGSQCLHHLQEGVDQMDALLRDIAEYTHADGRVLQPREINMDSVLEEAQRQAAGVLRTNDAVLTHEPLPSVTGDFFGLAIVFRNLITNACTFRSAAAPSIHVGSVRHGSEWQFSVRDNGIGFKPAYVETIFQPFKKLQGKQYPGSGLGLPLAKRIVEQHGGRMWADSVPGEGSTFWLSLPVQDAA
jgi:two-component system, chemotaxis family, sensor kinase Cph1